MPSLSKKVYAPGESGVITASFNPSRRNGYQNKKITVEFADADTKNMQLTLAADVKALVIVEPNKVYMRDVRHDTGATEVIRVMGRSVGLG